jgi:hypothetical protein
MGETNKRPFALRTLSLTTTSVNSSGLSSAHDER